MAITFGLALSGCAVPGQAETPATTSTAASEDAIAAPVEPVAPAPSVVSEQRSGEVKIDAKSAKKLEKMQASKKDPFALTRSMRKVRERERLAAEARAARKRAAAERAAKEAEAARKAEEKAARRAAKEREAGGLVVGDSVALGAQPCLTEYGFEVDAVQSRSFKAGFAALQGISRSSLPETVVIHLGTNGPFNASQFDDVMEYVGSQRHVVWVTIALPDRDLYSFESSLNDMIKEQAKDYPNVAIADWNQASDGQPAWFAKDLIHINSAGCQAFADVVNKAAKS